MSKVKQIAVLGLGVFGSTLAESLEENGVEVLAVDKDKECVERIANNVTRAVVADTTDKAQLLELGIVDFDTVVVSMSQHFEESVLTALVLKEIGMPHIIATARTKRKKIILEQLGVNEVINVQKDFALKLARSLVRKSIIDLTTLEDGYSIVEIKAPLKWAGKSLMALNVRQKYHMNIIGIIRDGKMNMDFVPEYVIREDDMLVVAAKDSVLENWDHHQ